MNEKMKGKKIINIAIKTETEKNFWIKKLKECGHKIDEIEYMEEQLKAQSVLTISKREDNIWNWYFEEADWEEDKEEIEKYYKSLLKMKDNIVDKSEKLFPARTNWYKLKNYR